MGYDYYIQYERETCPTCKRCDSGIIGQGYLSYNHSWVFRKYLNKDEGFRQLYNLPLPKVIEKLDIILERLRKDYPNEYKENFKQQDNYNDYATSDQLGMTTSMNGIEVKYNGWAKTVGNAYLHCRELLVKCKECVLDGYDDAFIYGD